MTVLVVILLLVLVFGIGGLIKGLLWATLIGLALLVVGVFLGWRFVTDRTSASRR